MGLARHVVEQSNLFTDSTLSCQKELTEITEKGVHMKGRNTKLAKNVKISPHNIKKSQYSTQGCGQAENDLGATCAHTGPGNVNQSHEPLRYYSTDKIKEQEQNGIIAIHSNRAFVTIMG